MRATRHVYAREFEGELVLLDLAKGSYYGLDAIGARLWTAITQGHTVAEVAEELASEYDVEPAVLRADLLDLVRNLAEKGLVEAV
ncbi:MAG: PqqD family protein [Deltaproteobacteria bacterium]|nr:PqqD family protein [Deltaproteobacteria bacterium]